MEFKFYLLILLFLLNNQVNCQSSQYRDAIIGLSVTVGVLGLIFLIIIITFVTCTLLRLFRTTETIKEPKEEKEVNEKNTNTYIWENARAVPLGRNYI
jgi:uncharacterized protein HemY